MNIKLTIEERIKLRDEIFKLLKSKSIIHWSKRFNRYIFPPIKSKFKKELESNIELAEKYNLYVFQFRSENEALYCITHQDDLSNHICPSCQKKLCTFYEDKSYYNKTCNNNECIQSLVHSDNAKVKSQQTNLKRYGVKHILQSKRGMDKFRNTCKERYGVEYPAQNEEIYSKVKKTNLERYGDTCSSRNEGVKSKSYKTNLERYGKETIFSTDFFKGIMKDKYNVEVYTQLNISNYDIWIDKDKFTEYIKEEYQKRGMFLSLSDICGFFNVWPDTLHKKVKDYELLEYFQIKDSSLEIKFIEALKSYGLIIEDKDRHNKDIILNEETGRYFEIDIIIPNTNIGIEINDISSHNSLNENHKSFKSKNYHLMKTIKAGEKGIRLIHIWEWEFKDLTYFTNLLKWIINITNKNKIRLNINECYIKEINIDEAKEFINLYSLYDYKDSDISIGLFYNNDLIQIISFIKYSESDKTYKISNMCTKYEYSIEKGYKKILNYFYNLYNPKSIIAFCELDKFSGKTFESLGFVKLKELEPSIVWCNKDLDHFEDNDSLNNHDKYIPIYNCGKVIYNLERR